MLRHLVFLGVFQVLILLVISLWMLHHARIFMRLFVPGEGRRSTQPQQQRGNGNFLHGRTVARAASRRKYRRSLDHKRQQCRCSRGSSGWHLLAGTGPHTDGPIVRVRRAVESGIRKDRTLGGLVMVVMVVVMVMRGCSERRSGEHHNQKCGCKNLLHALNLARCELWKVAPKPQESTKETSRVSRRERARSVNWRYS